VIFGPTFRTVISASFGIVSIEMAYLDEPGAWVGSYCFKSGRLPSVYMKFGIYAALRDSEIARVPRPLR
jgi:hypothetical protein